MMKGIFGEDPLYRQASWFIINLTTHTRLQCVKHTNIGVASRGVHILFPSDLPCLAKDTSASQNYVLYIHFSAMPKCLTVVYNYSGGNFLFVSTKGNACPPPPRFLNKSLKFAERAERRCARTRETSPSL